MLTLEEFKQLPLIPERKKVSNDQVVEFLEQNGSAVDMRELAEFLSITADAALLRAKQLAREGLVELRCDGRKFYVGVR